MKIELLELKHNLKDRNWDVLPLYKIDENEARKIVNAIEYEERQEKERMMNNDDDAQGREAGLPTGEDG